MKGAAAAMSAMLMALVLAPSAAGSSYLEAGFMDDDLLLYRGDDRADATLDELRAMGVERVRITVQWRLIAPRAGSKRRPRFDARDPAAYPDSHFDRFDHLLRAARHRGLSVLFNVTGPAPRWAAASADGDVEPSPKRFGDFFAMLGRRYSGGYADENQGGRPLPRVDTWSIWNEPNWGGLLRPQSKRAGSGWRPRAPHLYRSLVRAATDGLRATAHGDDTVLLGETAPHGVSDAGHSRPLRPVRFLRELFCIDERGRPLRGRHAAVRKCDFARRGPLRVTGFAHHPYSLTFRPGTKGGREDLLLGDTQKLVRVLDQAAATHRIPGGLPVWFSEHGYQTRPPDPYRGVALGTQARWLAETEMLAWFAPRVVNLTQFLLLDAEPRREFPKRDPRRWGTYQTGLRFADGRLKPAYDAYRMPLVAPAQVARGERVRLWGLVRPAQNGTAQKVALEFKPSGSSSWQPFGGTIDVHDGRGAFLVEVEPPGSGSWRFAWTPPAVGGRPMQIGGVPVPLGAKPQEQPPVRSSEVSVRVA